MYIFSGFQNLIENTKKTMFEKYKSIYTYYGDGSLFEIKTYLGTDLKRKIVFYHAIKKVLLICNYKEGLLNGVWKRYYQNGIKWYVGNYSDAKKTGKWSCYNKKGNLEKFEEYKEGKLNNVNNTL